MLPLLQARLGRARRSRSSTVTTSQVGASQDRRDARLFDDSVFLALGEGQHAAPGNVTGPLFFCVSI